jgi:hypothetical protein
MHERHVRDDTRAAIQIKAARDALTAGRYLSAGYYETQLKTAESIAEQLKGYY